MRRAHDNSDDDLREYRWPAWWREHDLRHDRGDCGRCELEEGHADLHQDCLCHERTLVEVGPPSARAQAWECDDCLRITEPTSQAAMFSVMAMDQHHQGAA